MKNHLKQMLRTPAQSVHTLIILIMTRNNDVSDRRQYFGLTSDRLCQKPYEV